VVAAADADARKFAGGRPRGGDSMNVCRRIALAALLTCLFASPLFAQQRLRVAVFDFQNNSEQSYWFSGDLGPALRNMIDTAFSENATLSKMFSVVERDKLALVLKEQGLASTGALDPTTAAKIGRILGVKYIVTGAISTFTINTTQGALAKFGGVGGKLVQAHTRADVRFIDTTTAERVISVSAEGEVKKGGGFFRGNSLSRDAEWGVASETLGNVSKNLVDKLVTTGLDRVQTAAGALEGKIIKVDGNQAWINLGSASGLKVGDRFRIISMGEDLIDPDSGAKLGSTEKETGTAEVTEVQDKFSVAKFTGAAKAKDTVRRQR
jgi:curli biogenesis system outer membrane secretion channel CsgG